MYFFTRIRLYCDNRSRLDHGGVNSLGMEGGLCLTKIMGDNRRMMLISRWGIEGWIDPFPYRWTSNDTIGWKVRRLKSLAGKGEKWKQKLWRQNVNEYMRALTRRYSGCPVHNDIFRNKDFCGATQRDQIRFIMHWDILIFLSNEMEVSQHKILRRIDVQRLRI